jgi:hypothetical protein
MKEPNLKRQHSNFMPFRKGKTMEKVKRSVVPRKARQEREMGWQSRGF